MENVLRESFITGVERVAAWADLLDAINVYPVADGDTGRNLAISLSPLRVADQNKEKVIHQLLLAARGNSGNIASQFFSAFYQIDSQQDIQGFARKGRDLAWKALSDPRRGTMLTLLDALAESALPAGNSWQHSDVQAIMSRLEKAVLETTELLPKLKKAGVVDAGALGMYIYFEGFFCQLAGLSDSYRPVNEVFQGRLQIKSSFAEEAEQGYCVDFVVQAGENAQEELERLAQTEESVVIIPEGDFYKIHLHTGNKEKIKEEFARLGSVSNWEADDLNEQVQEFMTVRGKQALHIMTDAAGSVTREDAKKFGITLLNSYVNLGDKCLPETHVHPEEMYGAMRQGVKVSTSQASVFERHQCYESALSRFDKVLYLCVGSVYTGNYNVAREWKKQHDLQNRLTIIDTGAASGRLGTIVHGVLRYLQKTNDAAKTIKYAADAVLKCEEYVFLDKLEYLARGGRLAKTSAFFGDMLKMKPVVSPQPEGAKKVGVVRNQKDQIKMALEKLAASLHKDSPALMMLEYSDNYSFVNGTMKKMLMELYPRAEIILQPLSLTSGAHMGPGTWAVAFLPLSAL